MACTSMACTSTNLSVNSVYNEINGAVNGVVSDVFSVRQTPIQLRQQFNFYCIVLLLLFDLKK